MRQTAFREYTYMTGVLPAAPAKAVKGTYDSKWKDKLLSWDGVPMTYDACGNLTKKGSTTYTWTQGRKLSAVNNGKSIQYFYDHTGVCTKKIVAGTTTEYRMAGSLLVSERTGNETIWYSYDSAANLTGVSIGGKWYFYLRNAQNDVVGLIDSSGNRVVEYKYDSWGNTISITGTLASTVGQKNPFRYRGYYLDAETGMYYLRSRYYDPGIRRFISADDIDVLSVEQGSPIQYNLDAYCLNNPVGRIDEDGHFSLPNWAKVAIGAVATVAAVGITVATGGAALPVLAGVAGSTISSAIIGGVTGGKQGAIDGAVDGFMWGGVGALAVSSVSAVKTVYDYKKTINKYNSLTKQYKGSGMEAHHIIEKRLAIGSKWKPSNMPSVELTKIVHRGYTNAWRTEVPYGTRYVKGLAYKYRLYKASNSIYRNSRVLKMAARYTILKM